MKWAKKNLDSFFFLRCADCPRRVRTQESIPVVTTPEIDASWKSRVQPASVNRLKQTHAVTHDICSLCVPRSRVFVYWYW